MPTGDRSPASSPSPASDEATLPLPELFSTQLADGVIYVGPDGTRYRIEKISDPDPRGSRMPASTSVSPHPTPAATQPAGFSTPSATGSGLPESLRRQQFYLQHPPDTAPRWGRSPSNANSCFRSSGTYTVQSPNAGTASPGSSPTGEIAGMMARLNIENYLGAMPLYTDWGDGGVQAAEALMDPDVMQRLPTTQTSPHSPSASTRTFTGPHEQSSPHEEPSSVSQIYTHSGAASQYWNTFSPNYRSYMEQTNAHLEYQRQRAIATTGLPQLLDYAIPVTPAQRASDPVLVRSASFSTPPDEEARGAQENRSECSYSPQALVSCSPPLVSPPLAYANQPPAAYDTVTPVIVCHQARTTASDGTSTGRDNVRPGEVLLFDGHVRSAQTLTSPDFRDAVLRVFRNTLTNDLRFYCRVDRESETYWMKADNAQLVPAYAYDQRQGLVVYIRDKESDKGNGYMQASQGNCRPSGIYQFPRLKDLLDFQEKLTGERVVLDIGSVRMVTLSRTGRSSTQYSSARLQIWHEVGGMRTAPSDVASFVTAGTTLSGPLRERLVASSSRLMLYLGRTGEYVTCFITDDLELKPEGQTCVKLRPRGGGPVPFFNKNRARWPAVKAHLEPKHGSEPAGFDIHGRVVDVDIGSEYDSYKILDIEFETSPSQDNFLRKWDEVIKERRSQRHRLHRIQEEMCLEGLAPQMARRVI